MIDFRNKNPDHLELAMIECLSILKFKKLNKKVNKQHKAQPQKSDCVEYVLI
jgi:hypothetical protein